MNIISHGLKVKLINFYLTAHLGMPKASRRDVDAGSKYGFSPIEVVRTPILTLPGTR